jgi:hypothetical protein
MHLAATDAVMLLVFVVEAVPANADVAATNVRARERAARFMILSFSVRPVSSGCDSVQFRLWGVSLLEDSDETIVRFGEMRGLP